MVESLHEVISIALVHLPEDTGCKVNAALSEHFVSTLGDLKDVTDVQYWQMGVPVGVANCLKRFAATFCPAHSQKDSSAMVTECVRANPFQKSERIEILQNKYGTHKGKVFKVKCASRLETERSEPSWVLESGKSAPIIVPHSHENVGWRWYDASRVSSSQAAPFPYMQACLDYLASEAMMLDQHEVPWDTPATEDDIVRIPASCLRWTHDKINPHLEFQHGDQGGQSVYKLFDDLLREKTTAASIDEPLEVVIHCTGDDVHLFSLSNRRLLPLIMLQATQRDTVVYANCIVRPKDEKFVTAFSTESNGLSIAPFDGESSHLGMPLFNHGRIALQTLQEMTARHPSVDTLHHVKLRRSDRAPSESSLTVGSERPRSQRSLIDVSPPAMLFSPMAFNDRRRRELWLFQSGTWTKATLPNIQREQHNRLSVPDPANPRHRLTQWALKPCVTCISGGELVLATEDEVWTIAVRLGKSTSRRIMEQPLPSTLNAASRLAPLLDNKLLLLTSEKDGADYRCHIMDRATKSWSHLPLSQPDKKMQYVALRCYKWQPAERICSRYPVENVEQLNDQVYVASAQFRNPYGGVHRISLQTGHIEILQTNTQQYPEMKDLVRLLGSQHGMHWINASGPDQLAEMNLGDHVQSRELLLSMSSHVNSGALTTNIDVRLNSGFLIAFGNEVYVLHLQQKSSAQWSKEQVEQAQRAAWNRPSRYDLQSIYHTYSGGEFSEAASFRLACISNLQCEGLCLADLPSASDEELLWQKSHPKPGVVLMITLADKGGNDTVYIFFYVCPGSDQQFQAGWAFDSNNTSRRLPSSALDLPACLPVSALKLKERVALIGGNDVALLMTQNACAQFDTSAEIWTPAPHVPA